MKHHPPFESNEERDDTVAEIALRVFPVYAQKASGHNATTDAVEKSFDCAEHFVKHWEQRVAQKNQPAPAPVGG